MSWIGSWWQQVSGTATQGLQITIIGMSLVFLALGLIILVLALLTRLPGLRTERQSQEQDTEQAGQAPSFDPTLGRATTLSAAANDLSAAGNDAELAQVAAIAVALARSQRPAKARARAQATAGKWKQYGRAHQLGL